jgi:hypothetical protein
MSLSNQDAAVIKGMLARGDFQHDIAAHFNENPARVAEIKSGEKFNNVKPADAATIPPLDRTGRFINPKDSAEKQYEQLRSFIERPPEGSRIVTFTPGLSELILDRINSNNRNQRPGNIKRFAAAMSSDNWLITGDTIKFSKKGFLLDGQNRLASSVRSQRSFRTHVVFGIADDAFDRIDSNAVRTNSDTFKIAGIANSKVSAPAVRWLMIDTDRGRKVENAELLVHLREQLDEERLHYWVDKAIDAGRVLPRGMLAALFYRFSEKNTKLCERFAADLKANKGNGKKLLDQIKDMRKQSLGRLHELQISALVVLAWNAYRAGKPLTKTMLKWDDGKEYPTIA